MGFGFLSSDITCRRHLFCPRVAWSLSRCHKVNSTARREECRPCTDEPPCWLKLTTSICRR